LFAEIFGLKDTDRTLYESYKAYIKFSSNSTFVAYERGIQRGITFKAFSLSYLRLSGRILQPKRES
jgi:hypothetical protein